MANTYTLISSNVLTSSAASVTFSSIPATYTDLVLRMSYRISAAGLFGGNPFLRFNSDTSTNYSYTFLQGNGSAAESARETSVNLMTMQSSDSAGNTADTFTSNEVYIPNYLSSTAKPVSQFKATEQNSTGAEMHAFASLYRGTSAISTILVSISGSSFVSGSSFYLYGIKNS